MGFAFGDWVRVKDDLGGCTMLISFKLGSERGSLLIA
jgi:hypothetical protein